MNDTFPWQHRLFKLCQGDYAVLVLNCRRKFLNMTIEIRLTFSQTRYKSSSFWKVILKSIITFLSNYLLNCLTIFQASVKHYNEMAYS